MATTVHKSSSSVTSDCHPSKQYDDHDLGPDDHLKSSSSVCDKTLSFGKAAFDKIALTS